MQFAVHLSLHQTCAGSCARGCTQWRTNDVHALTQQQVVHIDGPVGAVRRQDGHQLLAALHHMHKRRPALQRT